MIHVIDPDTCPEPKICGPDRHCGLPGSSSCSMGDECASGNCVFGACCSTASCPSCMLCGTGECAVEGGDIPGSCGPGETCSTQAECLTVDQEALPRNGEVEVSFGNSRGDNVKVAQLITIGVSGTLLEIRAAVECSARLEATLESVTSDGTQPSGAALAMLNTYQDDSDRARHADGLNAFVLDAPLIVNAGEKVALVVGSQYARDPCFVRASTSDVYSGGTQLWSSGRGTIYSTRPGDLAFRTLVRR